MYGRYTQDLLREYYSSKYSFLLTPIKVVILSKDAAKVKEIIYSIKGMDNNLPPIEFIFANDDNSKMVELKNEILGQEITLPLSSLIEGLRDMEGVMYSVTQSNKIYLPCHSSKGKSVEIPEEKAISVRQYFQIVHLDILNDIQEQFSGKSFYQGRSITWQELDNRFDVDRTISKDVIKEVRHALEKRVEAEIIYLTHYPGSGGSTVARRVAYEIHKDFPVFFLNETISSYSETLLVEKLLQIYQYTEIPCLVVVDNSNISRPQIEILERVVAYRLAKTVFLLVDSSFSAPKQTKNKFYIPATLDKNEANRFVAKFSQEYKGKDVEFQFILSDNPNVCNPFYFGLIANEHEYITIDKYVQKRLDTLNEKETDLLTLLSFCQIFASGKLREVPHFVISNFLEIDEEYIRLKKHTENQKIYDLIIEIDGVTWRTIHPLIAEQILGQLLETNDLGVLNPFSLKDFSIKVIRSLRKISENRNEQVLELLHNLFILRSIETDNNDGEEASVDFSDNLYNKHLFSKLINDLDNNNNRIEVFEALTTEFPYENAHFWGHFSRLYSIDKNFEKAISTIDKALEIDQDFIFYHIKGMCYRTELYRLKDKYFGKKEDGDVHAQMKEYFEKASEAFEITRNVAPHKEHGYIAFIQMVIQMIDFEYSISTLRNKLKDEKGFEKWDYTQFITQNNWCKNLLTHAKEVISDFRDNNEEFENSKIREKEILLLKYFGEKDKIIQAWNGLIGNQKFDQNLVRRQLAYAYLAKNEFDWEKARGKDIKRILELCEENLKNKVEPRDLRIWFEVSRRLNASIDELIKKVQEWEFKNQSLETAYILMCLFGVQAITGIKSGVDNYDKYRKIVSNRIQNTLYSKVFCKEWIGEENDNPILLNHRQIGEWSRDNSFFKESPIGLLRLKGSVSNYMSRTQGYIEVKNSGIQVMYQPGSCNHFSDDAQKQTKVSFYVGFNYDGARAFEVKNE